MFWMRTPVALLLAVCCLALAGQAVTLEQVISRENPNLHVGSNGARLFVGKDGLVYVANGGNPSGFVARLHADGSAKTGCEISYATTGLAVNADGVIANTAAHFTHAVNFINAGFKQYLVNNDFLVSDAVGWDAPGWIEAGDSGDFYALDQHRNRILRLTIEGKVVAIFPMYDAAEGKWERPGEFRVSEKQRCFYWTVDGALRRVGYDGKTQWKVPANVGGNAWDGYYGGFDTDAAGNVYLLPRDSLTVKKLGPDGKEQSTTVLQMGALKADQWHICDLRVLGTELLIKRNHPFELFQCYDLATGALKRVVSIEHERLSVTYPSDVWTAGAAVPFQLTFETSGKTAGPHWHVWARPFADTEYRELPLVDGQLQVPADAAGLYLLKVTPEVQPWQRDRESEYLVTSFVEVRAKGSKGTANVLTPGYRLTFRRGEAIPVKVLLRGADAAMPATVNVRLMEGARTLTFGALPVPAGQKSVQYLIPGALTASLHPGRYTLAVDAAGLTGIAQTITLGAGSPQHAFKLVEYGDYGPTYPTQFSLWNFPDLVAAHIDRTQRLGENLLVDRIGQQLETQDLEWQGPARADLDTLTKRLNADPAGVAPEMTMSPAPLCQTLSGYAAHGIDEMSILMGNDAGLPIGSGFDNRTIEQLQQAITKVTTTLAPYPSFRGWSWSSNWWVFNPFADIKPEKKAAFDAALKVARETGVWAPVLEDVSNSWLFYAVAAQERFNQTMKATAPKLVTASAAPYRNVNSYPPISLSNVDEVDLQIQWEQMGPPFFNPHNVDFYKRPNTRAWIHPEVWNDSGTGDQVFPALFAAVMRGADGVGYSGRLPNWGVMPDDSRLAYQGTISIFRTLNRTLEPYGPWLTTLKNNDRVAIIASGRMFRIDEWPNVWGRHFARVLEGYAVCLHAHHPASIVFTEDLDADTLKAFKAVLVIDQRVEMEPTLATALQAAKAAGTTVFYDNTCRPELMRGYTPLGVGFDRFEKDPHAAGDDHAYWRFPGYVLETLPVVKKALDGVVQPAAQVENPELFISERKAGDGRFLFVVNNTTPQLEPGQLWRAGLVVSSRLPVMAPIKLTTPGKAVYELFSLRPMVTPEGTVQADMRSVPMRIFAELPAAIAQVAVRGPKTLIAGQTLAWQVWVQDAKGAPIASSLPVRVRLLAGATVLDECVTAAGPAGANGTFTAPLNIPAPLLVLDAVELCSGKAARLAITMTPGAMPPLGIPLTAAPPVAATVKGVTAPADVQPVEGNFGPHIRDIAVIADGTQAVLNTMNWDQNLYNIDLATGQTRWQKRVGQYFTYAPQAIQDGFVVQGFDLLSQEGYHLYLGNADGQFARRFALYGLSRRATQRFVPGILNDRMNNFAVAPDGSWVASAGDLGLAVWSRDGKLRWSQDAWKTNRATARWEGMDGWSKAYLVTPRLTALGADTLLAVDGMTATAYNSADGAQRWQLTLAANGEVRTVTPSHDGTSLAILTTTQGGRIFVLRGNQVVDTIPTAADNIGLSADGANVVAVERNVLKYYTVGKGLQWSFAGDDTLRTPRFAPDGRVVVCSELGSVYVLDAQGMLAYQTDLQTIAVPAWLPGGDLLLGTWMGRVTRLDAKYQPRWRARLQPEAVALQGKLLADDGVPTTRITEWGNAEATPLPLTPNLLQPNTTMISFIENGRQVDLTQDVKGLIDGKPDAPAKPWLLWGDISWLGEGSAFNWLQLDTFHTQLHLTGITLVEDPTHPESWLRDAYLEYWDAAKEHWVFAQSLLSDAAVHTHLLQKPVEAARFRVVLAPGLVGNLRLGEVVFHGASLGCSHPDVQAKRPVAVLFDEQVEDMKALQYGDNGFGFKFDGGYAGNVAIQIKPEKQIMPLYRPPFGHMMPNWDMEITENPQPGQYRHLQFAWKGTPQTTGMALCLGGVWFVAGETPRVIPDYQTKQQVSATVPTQWTTVRLDLWKTFNGKPPRIQYIGLAATGGDALYDQILLGRTAADLPAGK